MTDAAVSSIPQTPHDLEARLLLLPDGAASGLIYIEQLAAGSETGCNRATRPYLLSWNRHKRIAVIWRPDCKTWGCSNCGEINRRRLVARAYHGAAKFMREGRKLAFFTITSHERLSAAATLEIWPKAWSKLRKRLARLHADFAYLAVPELHKDGRLHMHGLMTDPPTLRWLKDNARACGLGYQDDLQEAYSLGVAGYIAKYSAKMLQFSNFPKGTRRFRTSQNWPKLPMLEPDPDVDTIPLSKDQPLAAQIRDWLDDGYDVVYEQSNSFWEYLSGRQQE